LLGEVAPQLGGAAPQGDEADFLPVEFTQIGIGREARVEDEFLGEG
jgi:hypothetical protein